MNEKELIARIDALEARVSQLEKSLASPAPVGENRRQRIFVEKDFIYKLYSRRYDSDGFFEYSKDGFKAALDCLQCKYDDEAVKNNLLEILAHFKKDLRNNMLGSWYTPELGQRILFTWFVPKKLDWEALWVLLSDGRTGSKIFKGNDLNAVKSIAVIAGYDVPKGMRKDKLAAELVSKYGDGKTAVIGDYLLYADGRVFQFREGDTSGLIRRFRDDADEIREYYKESIPLKIDESMSPKEQLEALNEYNSGLSPKVKSQPMVAQAEQFERVAKRMFGELGVEL